MTNQEAIKRLWQIACSIDEPNNPTRHEHKQAIGRAVEALQKQDKYRWYDLRKDPTDLPPVEIEVEICTEKHYEIGTWSSTEPKSITERIITHAIYEDGKVSEEDSDWTWADLAYCGGGYDEENDCYYIPEGWYEYHHYQEEIDFNAVDDVVIVWREIEPFEK